MIVMGAAEAVHGNMSVGEFVAFASYNTVLVWPVRGLGRILSDMSKAGVSFERVGYIIQGKEEPYQKKGEKRQLPMSMDIAFSHVSFAYEQGKKVLEDVSFSIPQGQVFGILGGTGSGKSTIVQLLTRLYELDTEKNTECSGSDNIAYGKDSSAECFPTDYEGSITIGGIDIRSLPLEWIRRNVGMVLQEPFLYSKSIRENIAASASGASLEDIRKAAQTACVDEAIMDFADGYDTLVGERGVTLSGGQRQRVAIARMLLKKAPVMVFDDSLSAVDGETDFKIRMALKDRMQKATVILISHRITTLMGADKILVLNHGRVEEMGTHEELIQNQGIYQRIYEIQMGADDRKDILAFADP